MFRKQHPVAGSRPGTLTVPADSPPTRIRVVTYSRAEVIETPISEIAELDDHVAEGALLWIDVQGLRDVELLEALADRFEVHPLALEAVVNVPHPPNVESYPNQLLVIGRLLESDSGDELVLSQVGMILGRNYVITFHERHSNLLDPVRRRLALPTSRLRSHGVDYLAYAIIDTAVDAFYPALQSIGEQIESLEREVIVDPRPELIQRISAIKNRLLNLRRTAWAQREAVHKLQAEDSELIDSTVKTFLRDTYNHCVQTADVVEMYREMSSGLLNTYTSSVAHRSNEVMKLLAIVSTIFVPLTFLAGIYGMNFEAMPELNYRWGYPTLLATMVVITVALVAFFFRKGWLHVSAIVEPEAATVETGNSRSVETQYTHLIAGGQPIEAVGDSRAAA